MPEIDELEPSVNDAWSFAHPVTMLALLAACHFLVDIVAGTTSPIWPTLESHHRLDQASFFRAQRLNLGLRRQRSSPVGRTSLSLFLRISVTFEPSQHMRCLGD